MAKSDLKMPKPMEMPKIKNAMKALVAGNVAASRSVAKLRKGDKAC